jgi:RHS repeat-associated protein
VADYEVPSAAAGFELRKEYVRAAGRLLAMTSTCGPRPTLALDSPVSAGGAINLVKEDAVPPTGDYIIHIESASGQTKTLSRPASLDDHFMIAESELWPDESNWIRIQAEAECGHTGYSNAVSYYYLQATECLPRLGAHFEFMPVGDPDLEVEAAPEPEPSCPIHALYQAYYQPEGTTIVRELLPSPDSTPFVALTNQPAGAGYGEYWFTAIDPATMKEVETGPPVTVNAANAGAAMASTTVQPGLTTLYVHTDHLGSTRLLTDELGTTVGSWKYYPFGLEAESADSDATRTKFTGHERDEGLGVDYMLARYCSPSLGRFVSTDPVGGIGGSSQSWNRYIYVRANPVIAIDPDGREVRNLATDGVTSVTVSLIKTI